MHSPFRSHAFLHFLPVLLLLCFVLCCHSACSQTLPKTSSPNNGQYGTPNLPNAVSNFIDWNRMRSQANSRGVDYKLAYYVFVKIQSLHLKYLSKGTPSEFDTAISELNALLKQLDMLSGTGMPDQYQSIYAGVEMRGGSGRTDYVIPAVTYSNEFAGYDVGADFLTESGNQSHYDSFGLSFRYEVTNQGRALIKEVETNAEMNALIRQKLNSLRCTISILAHTKNQISEDDPNLLILKELQRSLQVQPRTAASSIEAKVQAQINELAVLISQLTRNTNDLGNHVVRQSLSPALSALAGVHFIDGNGNITSQGLSVSQLFPFGKGLPGVTLLYVAEDLQASLSQGYRHNALQQGAAIIFQDRTPAANENYTNAAAEQPHEYGRANADTKYSDLLRPPWKVKIGIEYITPALGLTKTYTGFIRYRDPSTYADITLAYGEDGTGKNYGSLSIGRSFLF